MKKFKVRFMAEILRITPIKQEIIVEAEDIEAVKKLTARDFLLNYLSTDFKTIETHSYTEEVVLSEFLGEDEKDYEIEEING